MAQFNLAQACQQLALVMEEPLKPRFDSIDAKLRSHDEEFAALRLQVAALQRRDHRERAISAHKREQVLVQDGVAALEGAVADGDESAPRANQKFGSRLSVTPPESADEEEEARPTVKHPACTQEINILPLLPKARSQTAASEPVRWVCADGNFTQGHYEEPCLGVEDSRGKKRKAEAEQVDKMEWGGDDAS